MDCDLQAVVPAIGDWLVSMEPADREWEATIPKLDPTSLIPGLRQVHLSMEGVLHSLVCALNVYLDGEQKWHQLAQRGLEHLLIPLAASMWEAAKPSPHQRTSEDEITLKLRYFDTLAIASRSCSILFCIIPALFLQSQVMLCHRQWPCLHHAVPQAVAMFQTLFSLTIRCQVQSILMDV